ncbi:MAG: hypothetical protein RL095_2184 [Verrucomicrobiota bacterium]|jgi:glycogen synthase
MKTLLLTNEYPPNVYGGAGVHVEYLSRELAKLIPVEVRSFVDKNGSPDADLPNLKVRGHNPALIQNPAMDPRFKSVFSTLARCESFAMEPTDAEIVHCHTWYAHFGGIMTKLLYGSKLFITVHSLEPLRPWKREQLGGGYEFSSWVERTALEMADQVICVSRETQEDVLRLFPGVKAEKTCVIYNGIDTEEYVKTLDHELMSSFGIDLNQPMVLFLGRITRQKGIIHLVNAIKDIDPAAQVVLCAGAPDTPEIKAEMLAAVEAVQAVRPGVIWIQQMVSNEQKIKLYSHADVFCCPSIYEPFGIINLEAMACETAVVASAVGGIKEVVVPGVTGLLVPVEQLQVAPFEPVEPAKFSRDLAAGINALLADPAKRAAMAAAGRQRVEDIFSWKAIAEQTVEAYRKG